MNAVVGAKPIVDENTGKPQWELMLRCGHLVVCGRESTRPPTSRKGDCRKCKQLAKWRRKDQRKRDRKATGLDMFVFRLRNG
jgi:hypothetical protein